MVMEELREAREKPDLHPWALHYECPLDPDDDSGADEADTQRCNVQSAEHHQLLRMHQVEQTHGVLKTSRGKKVAAHLIDRDAEPPGSRGKTMCLLLIAYFWLQVGPMGQDTEAPSLAL